MRQLILLACFAVLGALDYGRDLGSGRIGVDVRSQSPGAYAGTPESTYRITGKSAESAERATIILDGNRAGDVLAGDRHPDRNRREGCNRTRGYAFPVQPDCTATGRKASGGPDRRVDRPFAADIENSVSGLESAVNADIWLWPCLEAAHSQRCDRSCGYDLRSRAGGTHGVNGNDSNPDSSIGTGSRNSWRGLAERSLVHSRGRQSLHGLSTASRNDSGVLESIRPVRSSRTS